MHIFFQSLSGVNDTVKWSDTLGLLLLLLLFYSPSSTDVVKLLLYPTVLSESANSECFFSALSKKSILGSRIVFGEPPPLVRRCNGTTAGPGY